MGCHTIMGEGAYYESELTRVFSRRGETYIHAVLTAPEGWGFRGLVIVKCSLVGFQFMELRKAHIFWKVAFISIIGIFIVIVSFVVLV